jgi:hypothetical protein
LEVHATFYFLREVQYCIIVAWMWQKRIGGSKPLREGRFYKGMFEGCYQDGSRLHQTTPSVYGTHFSTV